MSLFVTLKALSFLLKVIIKSSFEGLLFLGGGSIDLHGDRFVLFFGEELVSISLPFGWFSERLALSS